MVVMLVGISLLSDPRLMEYYQELRKMYVCDECGEEPIYLAYLNHRAIYLCRECMLAISGKAKKDNISFGVQFKFRVDKSVEHQLIKRKVLLDMVAAGKS